MNVTFIKMDESEVCQRGTNAMAEQKPRYSTSKSATKRFQPKILGNSTSFLDDVLELVLDPGKKNQYDAEDRCFRLNGELISVPQNKEDEERLDKLIWEFMMNNIFIDDSLDPDFILRFDSYFICARTNSRRWTALPRV